MRLPKGQLEVAHVRVALIVGISIGKIESKWEMNKWTNRANNM